MPRDIRATAAHFVPGQSVIPSSATLTEARNALVTRLPDHGLGDDQTVKLIEETVCPALSGSSKSPNFYGFVVGGVTPIAKFADNVVTEYDQTLSNHIPTDSIATEVEDAASRLLCQLLELDPNDWNHRTFTTGATVSNVLGLACGRQWVLQRAGIRNGLNDRDVKNLTDVGEVGLAKAMKFANVDEVQVLTTVPHSSLRKAAGVVGLGRNAIKLINRTDTLLTFDLERLEQELATPRTASIVAVSCAEVNAGLYTTTGEEMKVIRSLCNKYGAWLHVDGAFGLQARCLPSEPQYAAIADGWQGMELADSITGDGHKLLNVPYDCGFFFSKHPDAAFATFQNAGATYLSTEPSPILQPLHHGIENSRRFRALPVYANLVCYGRQGYREMLQRQIALARKIAAVVRNHEGYTLLPQGMDEEKVFMVVLFRAEDDALNTQLVRRINKTSRIYVSGTQWDGSPASRFAVSNWQVDVERDIQIIKEVLDELWQGRDV